MLNDYLIRNNLTCAAFGRRLGVTSQAVSRWLHGHSIPRPDTLQSIADLTDGEIPVEYWTQLARDRTARRQANGKT